LTKLKTELDEIKVASRDFEQEIKQRMRQEIEQEMRQRMRQENVNEVKIASRDFRQENVNVFRFDKRNVSSLL
jgi:hypothetical protein